MSDQIAAKFAQVNIRSERFGDDASSSNISRTRAEEDFSRANPWKPISLAENNALEADAWPEPSVHGDQRRPCTYRQSDEKFKRKIKWQNYDVDQSACGFHRGRGRGAFYAHSYAHPSTNNIRRGGFRGRMPLDATRNPRINGYYTRHPGRLPIARFPVDSSGRLRDPASTTCAVVDTQIDQQRVTRFTPEIPRTNEKPRTSPVPESHTSLTTSAAVDSTSSRQSDTDRTMINLGSVPAAASSKNTYRDRSFGSQHGPDYNTSGTYEAGPVGRARRSYLRQHPVLFTDPESLSNQHALVAATPVQPLFPIHAVAPFTYVLPGTTGVSGAFWSPGVHFTQTPQFTSTSTINQTHVPQTQSSPSTHMSRDVQIASKTDEISPQMRPISFGSLTNTGISKTSGAGDVIAEVVDVHQMVAYISSVGWNKITIPTHLKDHPVIAPYCAAALSNTNDSHAFSLKPVEPSLVEINSKPDDVVIVEDCVFFVPRNANKTKFLKFTSKLDYIRHHVEYYFSESNLSRDTHLVSILEANQNVCPISDLLQFNRLRWVSTTDSELLEAVSQSSLLTITYSVDGFPSGVQPVSDPCTEKTTDSTHSDLTFRRAAEGAHSATQNLTNGLDKPDVSLSPGVDTASLEIPTDPVESIAHVSSTVGFNTTMHTANASVHIPIASAPRLHPHFAQPAVLISPVPRMDVINYPTGTVPLSNPASLQLGHYYPPSDSSGHINPPPQNLPFNHPAFYPPQQTPILNASATASHSPLIPSSGASPDVSGSPAFYRLTSAGQVPPLGTFHPQLSGSPAFPLPTSSPVFLQFVPATHPTHMGGYAQVTAPLLHRALGPISPAGIWIPYSAGNNIGPQPVPSVTQGFQTLFTAASVTGTINNGALYSALPNTVPSTSPALFMQNLEGISSLSSEPKIVENAVHQQTDRYSSKKNGSHCVQHSSVDSTYDCTSNNPSQLVRIAAVSFGSDSATASPPSASVHSTPKKATVSIHP